MVTSPDTTVGVTTKPDSAATESRECRDLAAGIGLTGKVMESSYTNSPSDCVSPTKITPKQLDVEGL